MKESLNLCKKVKDAMIELLYPTTCIFCGKIQKNGICAACRKQLVYISEPRCKKCGKPVRYQEQEYCADCSKKEFAYEQGRSLWLHKPPVNTSVYQFKYHNRRVYAEIYAEEMNRCYGRLIKQWGVEALLPVPLHKKRQKKRGYNQALLLAVCLSKITGIPVEHHALHRCKCTEPQKKLSDKERKQNLKNAFRVDADWKPRNCVLLIDDIYTTGSTIHTIACLLKEKGVQDVYFLTISIGQGF